MFLYRKKYPKPQPLTTTAPVEFPVGTFVKTRKAYYYIAGTDKRLRFLTQRVLDSWSPHRVVETTESSLSQYKIASKMKFRNGSLIANLADGKIYLISEGKRRHIQNPDILERIGASYKDVVRVSLNEIKLHEQGEPLV